jgi:hypothetical protein
MEKCDNCGRQIGNLETPATWKDHVVCQACAITLKAGPAAIDYERHVSTKSRPRQNGYFPLKILGLCMALVGAPMAGLSYAVPDDNFTLFRIMLGAGTLLAVIGFLLYAAFRISRD